MADASLLGAIRQLGYLALFVLALEVAGRNDRVEFMTRLLFWGICLHALWAMVALRILGDIHWWGEKTAYQGVATGTFINRNNFAAFLGVGVVLGTAIVADLVNVPRVRKAGSTRNPRASLVEILVPVVGIALLIVTILATQSRMGLAAAFLGSVTVLGIMRVRQGRRAVLAAAEAFLVVVLVAMPLFALSGAGVLERSLDIGDEQNGRLVLWQQVLGMIGERPITGFGLDSFYPAFELFHRPPLTTALVWDYAHNSYLSLWLEAGILFGSLPIIAGAVLIWRSAVRAWQARTHFAVSAAGVGVGVLMLISSAVDFPLEIQANMFLFLLVMAIASADRRRRMDED
ncbi:O-antigen ligase family protein [Actibacterium mucosum]|nr:O-antigen ligase family protein [Actibacterium mucosum]